MPAVQPAASGSTRLTSAQVAARLGVKRETLYAYVSRGLLASERAEDGGSTFDPLDVEAFASTRGRGVTGPEVAGRGVQGRPIMVLDSALALIENDELYLRGRPARDLARRLTFEEAVEVLWQAPAAGDLESGFVSRREVVSAVRRATRALGPHARLVDELSLAVTVCASWDPVRGGIQPGAVRDAGRQMIATMVDSLADVGGVAGVGGVVGVGGVAGRAATAAAAPVPRTAPLAARLWPKLSANPATAENLRLLESAMVLCMEHDLATSTMAARVAASARVSPYAAVAAALNSFDSTLHGAASVAAAELIEQTVRTGNAERALADALARGPQLPGFGHLVYRRQDPRAAYLLHAMRRAPGFGPVTEAVDRLAAVVEQRSPRPINLDLALGALVLGAGLRRDAGELVFAVSRTAGWIGHIIEEYAQPALRLRPESRYTGIRPPSRA